MGDVHNHGTTPGVSSNGGMLQAQASGGQGVEQGLTRPRGSGELKRLHQCEGFAANGAGKDGL